MGQPYPRIAIITGATSGIGEATAKKFVANGYAVVGNGRNAEKLKALEIELGAAFCGVAGDASDTSVIDSLFEAAIDKFARPADIVVANAGRGLGGPVTGVDVSRFEEILKLNVAGVLAIMQKAAQQMVVAQQTGYPKQAADIVVLGSVSGRNISPFSAVYGSTKYAVHALAEGLRREVGPKGVRVSLVEPGLVITGFQDGAGYSDEMVNNFKERFGLLLYGEDVANTIHFVVSQPPHVHVNDIMLRPTRQDYP